MNEADMKKKQIDPLHWRHQFMRPPRLDPYHWQILKEIASDKSKDSSDSTPSNKARTGKHQQKKK